MRKDIFTPVGLILNSITFGLCVQSIINQFTILKLSLLIICIALICYYLNKLTTKY